MGEKLIKLQTDDNLVKTFSKEGFTDIRFGCGYGEEDIYFILDQQYFPIEEYKNATQKDEYECLYTKGGDDNKEIVQYGNDFINCKFFSPWIQ